MKLTYECPIAHDDGETVYTVTACYTPEEPQTRDDPGAPAELEIYEVKDGDTRVILGLLSPNVLQQFMDAGWEAVEETIHMNPLTRNRIEKALRISDAAKVRTALVTVDDLRELLDAVNDAEAEAEAAYERGYQAGGCDE